MKESAIGLASLGRNGDDSIAHVASGEVVLPVEAMEDNDFANVVSARLEAMGLDPRARVVGSGIASLNDITGLEEFGFFKKIGKSIKKRVKKIARTTKKVVKKVVKPIAKVAQFIPGPWQPAAALIAKVSTVYDVAKGRANPLALLTVAGPTAAGGSISSNVSALTKAGGSAGVAGLAKGLGKGLASGASAIKSGIGSLLTDPKNALGNIGNVLNSASYSGQVKAVPPVGAQSQNLINKAITNNPVSSAVNQATGGALTNVGTKASNFLNTATGGAFGQTPNLMGGLSNIQNLKALQAGGGQSVSLFGNSNTGQFFNNMISGATGIGTPQQGSFGAQLANLVQGVGGLGVGGMGGPAQTNYQIQKGDTLTKIAQQYGVSIQDIMNANPSITDPNKIYAGNNLVIPVAGGGQQGGGLGSLGALLGGQSGQGQVGQGQVGQGGQPVFAGQNPQTGECDTLVTEEPIDERLGRWSASVIVS